MFRQLKHEIFREPAFVAGNLLIQTFGRYAVQLREIEVDHDLLTANQIDSSLDELDRCSYTSSCEVLLVRHDDRVAGHAAEMKTGCFMGVSMNHRLYGLQLAVIITLSSFAADAQIHSPVQVQTQSNTQTRSNCEPSPPMQPNAKPGVGGLTLSRDGKTLLVATGDGKIRFIDLNTGEIKRTLTGHTNMVYIATLSPDEKLLASSSRDQTARIWDVGTGQILHTLGGFRCAVKAVAFSPDGTMVAASGNDGMLKLWDVKTGKELKSLVHRDSPDIDMATYAFVFGRNGKQIYAANGDGTISVWDVATGKETRNWKAHDNYVFRLLLTSDHRRLVSFGDAVVKVWDAATGRELQTLSMPKLPGASSISSAVAISHNGKLIAASDVDLDAKQTTYLAVNTVVWNAKSGEKIYMLPGHGFDVNGLIFTRDGRFLITGSVDRTIKVWNMTNGEVIRVIALK